MRRQVAFQQLNELHTDVSLLEDCRNNNSSGSLHGQSSSTFSSSSPSSCDENMDVIYISNLVLELQVHFPTPSILCVAVAFVICRDNFYYSTRIITKHCNSTATEMLAQMEHVLVVTLNSIDPHAEPIYVDMAWRERFSLFRKTPQYEQYLSHVPQVFVGTWSTLKKCVVRNCAMQEECIKVFGMAMAPWRKPDSICQAYLEFAKSALDCRPYCEQLLLNHPARDKRCDRRKSELFPSASTCDLKGAASDRLRSQSQAAEHLTETLELINRTYSDLIDKTVAQPPPESVTRASPPIQPSPDSSPSLVKRNHAPLLPTTESNHREDEIPSCTSFPSVSSGANHPTVLAPAPARPTVRLDVDADGFAIPLARVPLQTYNSTGQDDARTTTAAPSLCPPNEQRVTDMMPPSTDTTTPTTQSNRSPSLPFATRKNAPRFSTIHLHPPTALPLMNDNTMISSTITPNNIDDTRTTADHQSLQTPPARNTALGCVHQQDETSMGESHTNVVDSSIAQEHGVGLLSPTTCIVLPHSPPTTQSTCSLRSHLIYEECNTPLPAQNVWGTVQGDPVYAPCLPHGFMHAINTIPRRQPDPEYTRRAYARRCSGDEWFEKETVLAGHRSNTQVASPTAPSLLTLQLARGTTQTRRYWHKQ